MIKATINKDKAEPKREYPYLGKYIGVGNLIVLFSDKSTGVCLISNFPSQVGKYESNWSENDYRVFVGELTLKNGG